MRRTADISIYKGTTYSREFMILDDDGSPRVITNDDTLSAFLRREYESPDADAVQFDVDVMDGQNGTVRIYLTAAQTALLEEKTHVWGLIRTTEIEDEPEANEVVALYGGRAEVIDFAGAP